MSAPDPTPAPDSWQKGVRDSSSLSGLGIQLAGSMLFYVLAGYFLDRWLDTEPWLLLTGSVVGMIAFFFQIVRVTRRLSSRPARSSKSSRSLQPSQLSRSSGGGDADDEDPEKDALQS